MFQFRRPEPETVALYRDIRQQRAGAPGDVIEAAPQPEAENPPLPDGPSVAVQVPHRTGWQSRGDAVREAVAAHTCDV